MSGQDKNKQVIIIDDEAIVRDAMLQTLELEGYQAKAFLETHCTSARDHDGGGVHHDHDCGRLHGLAHLCTVFRGSTYDHEALKLYETVIRRRSF